MTGRWSRHNNPSDLYKMGGFVINLLVLFFAFVCFRSPAFASSAEPAFDQFKATFATDLSSGLNVLDGRANILSERFTKLMEEAAITLDPAFVEMTSQECQDLKLKVIRASTVDLFEVQLTNGRKQKISFCEGLAAHDDSGTYKDVKFGRVDKPIINEFGLQAVTTIGWVYTAKDNESRNAGTVLYHMLTYRLNVLNEIVEIVNAKVESLGESAKFPGYEFSMVSRDANGGVYSIRIPKTGASGSFESTETYHNSDPWIATVQRVKKMAFKGQDVVFESVIATRPKTPATWIQQFLFLPIVMAVENPRGGRYYSEDGLTYLNYPTSFETLVTKRLNGRDLCSSGSQVENRKNVAVFPADFDNSVYCSRLP